jgi:N-methylhydantoinase A
LTDANIVLHRLDPVALLGGQMPVDKQAARAAIASAIATPLGLTVEQAALGIIRIAVANMSRAIRSVSTEKGHDTASFALFPYGGAGPLHAVAVAEECGMRRVLVPVEPGTLCARGILLSDVSLDLVRSEILPAAPAIWPRIAGHFAAMEDAGRAWLDGERIKPERRRFETVIDARYKGQNHEVQVRLPSGPPALESFLTGFAEAHRREYGYAIPDRPVETVNARLKAIGLIDRPDPRFTGGTGSPEPKARRRVHFDDGWHDTPIYDRAALAVCATLAGPAVIDEMSATTVVPAGWSVHVDTSGNLMLETT